jgi:class 3 adenylate cyclase/predicted ATPase
MPGHSESPGERRHLTVLFSDLVSSTELSRLLDPEDLRDLVLAYQEVAGEAVQSNSGFVAQYLGDGILAYFGYPEAHEDDTRLAVSAGLAIARGIQALSERLDHTRLRVRVGIHSGEVVVGDIGNGVRLQHDSAIGDTPNIAARLQSLAEPDTVVISGVTAGLVTGRFSLESLGPLSLKGVGEQITAYRVLDEILLDSDLDARTTRGLSPLVGRDGELQALEEAWGAVMAGAGRVVVMSGDPGLGKSRLVWEMEHRFGHEASVQVRLQCSPHRGNSVLFPVIEHLNRVVGEYGTPEERLERLQKHLEDARLPIDETGPLIADLLSIAWGDRWAPVNDSPERRKRRTLDAIHAWLMAGVAAAPVLVVTEDVQWIDPTTLELMAPFFGPEPVERALVVITCRSGHIIQWPDRPHVQRMALDRLPAESMLTLIEALSGGSGLPSNLTQEISTRTDGVPLFAEEMVHAVLESGVVVQRDGGWVSERTLPERLVPATLRESLMSRLDRLGSSRELAQLMACVGREATDDLLRALVGDSDSRFEEHLQRLVSSDMLHRRLAGNQVTYTFKHWLVRDVAYETLLRSRRQQYHERIARTLEAGFPRVVATQPEVVAQHLAAAGLEAAAVPYLQKAGELAHRRSSNVESIGHLNRALEYLRREPESPGRDRLELQLLIALGAPLTASRGYSAPEVERTYSRAGELCTKIGGETPQMFRALYGTWRVHLLRADYRPAITFASELQRLAERSRDHTDLAAAHRAVGSTLFYLGGDLAVTRSHLESVMAAGSRDVGTRWLTELQDVVDPWVTCHAYHAWTQWLQGNTADAEASSLRAMSLADSLGHPFTVALSLSFDSWLRQFMGDPQGVRRQAERALNLSREQGFAFWIGWARIMVGWADATLGDPDGGMAAMRDGLEEWRSVGSELGTTYFLSLIAETTARQGRVEEALLLLADADALVTRTGEEWWQPELYRLRGELLYASGDFEQGSVMLKAAVREARRRATVPLLQRAELSMRSHDLAIADEPN